MSKPIPTAKAEVINLPADIKATAAAVQAPRPISKGRIVMYKLSEQDIGELNRRIGHKEHGCQHGEVFPAMVVRVHSASIGTSTVNLQVLVDGHATLWARSIPEGATEGQWMWPAINS